MKHLSIMMLLVFLTVVSLNAQNKDKDVRALVQQKMAEGKRPVPVQGGLAFINDNAIELQTEDGQTLSIPTTGSINRLQYNRGLAVAEENTRELLGDHMKLRVFSGKKNAEIYTDTVDAQPYAPLNEDVIFTEARTYAEWDGLFKVIYLPSGETVIPEFAKVGNYQATPLDENRILVLVDIWKKYRSKKGGPAWKITGVMVYEYNVQTRQETLIETFKEVAFGSPHVGAVHFIKKENDVIGFFLDVISENSTYDKSNYYEISNNKITLVDQVEGSLYRAYTDKENTYALFRYKDSSSGYLRNCSTRTNYKISSFWKKRGEIGAADNIISTNGTFLLSEQTSVRNRGTETPYIIEIDKQTGEVTKRSNAVLINGQTINF